MTDIISFDEAIADSEQYSKRHLLLGNGFSIGCRKDIFHYASLFSRADFSSLPEAKEVFRALETQDFEIAIKTLESAAKIFPLYAPNDLKNAETMRKHATDLKELLVTTIAKNHPLNPGTIEESEFQACRKFLSYFLNPPSKKEGHVFSLNYDLLLYWVLMHDDNSPNDRIILNRNDSFGNDENKPDADYVVWQGETEPHRANIYFLHGALHLFDSGSEIQKYTWIRKGISLVEQARAAINSNKFPLFVAEGTSKQKKNKIRHNAYLYQGLKVLTKNADQKKPCFFIFGHSLAENDDHILVRLGRGKFKKLYVGIYGESATEENKIIIARAKNIAALRDNKHPLEVVFFSSSSATVWGKEQ